MQGRYEVRSIEGGAPDEYGAYRRGVLAGERATLAAARRLAQRLASSYTYGVVILDARERRVVEE